MTEKSKELVCTPCALQFDKKVVFDLHISLVHETTISESGEMLAIEENQDFVLASEAIQKISPKTSASFPCESCNKVFTLNGSLKRHIKSIHEENRPFKCTACEKTFKLKNYLKRHFSSVHENKRPHKCTICKKTFKENNHLKRHFSSVHEMKKPHKCELCNLKFGFKFNLKAHNTRVHKWIKSNQSKEGDNSHDLSSVTNNKCDNYVPQ